MENLTISSFYGSVLALFYVYLSLNVIKSRRKSGVALLNGNDKKLTYALRAHGNFFEYSVFFAVLLIFGESLELWPMALHLISIVFLIGRVSHAYGFITQKDGKFRVRGMQLTFLPMIALAALNLVFVFL